MKHPLTSKERRGLVAVAAAALLCVGSGFVFRNCGSRNSAAPVIVNDSTQSEKSEKSESSEKSDTLGRASGQHGALGKAPSHRETSPSHDKVKSEKSGKAKTKKTKKKAPARTYPTREPLDEPIE